LSRRPETSIPGPLQTLDQGAALLAEKPGLVAIHWLGSAPFVLGLLLFSWRMAVSGRAWEILPPASAAMAVLFLWMKCCHAWFASAVADRLADRERGRLTAPRFLKTLSRQAVVQAPGLFVLPLALALGFPLPWAYAFFQNASALDGREGGARELASVSWSQANLAPGNSVLMVCVLGVFELLVFVNLAAFFLVLPGLAKSLLGMEFTLFRARLLAADPGFWAACAGVSWLAADPLAKAAYAVRCHYGLSLRTGEDLAARARRAFGVACVALALFAAAAALAPRALAASPPEESFARALDQSVQTVLKDPRYAWKLPRAGEVKQEKPPGPLAGAVSWLAEWLKKTVKAVAEWVGRAVDWLRDLFPDPPEAAEAPRKPGVFTAWWALLAAGLALAGALAVLLLRVRRAFVQPAEAVEPAVAATVVDLADEGVSPDDLPEDEWKQLARSLLEQGRVAEGLRALYLGTLAGLSRRRLILVARHKSNHEYLRELAYRAGAFPALVEGFSFQTRLFEGAWYGGKTPSPAEIAGFWESYERAAGHGR